MMAQKEPKHVAYKLCINTNTIIINIIVVLTGSKLCFTINRFLFFFSDNIIADGLANSKRQPCFYPPYSHAQEDTQNWQKK